MAVQNLSGLFQTVIGAFNEATHVLAPTHEAINSIYWDHRPDQPGVLGQTINVAIPVDPTGSVQDIGTGDLILSDVGFTTTPIVFNRHPSFAFPVKDWEQFNTPYNIKNNLVDASFTGIKNSINAVITSQFTSGNFNVNSVISATNHVITTTQFTGAQAVLSDQRVPIRDVKNMQLLSPSTPYTAMTDPTTGTAGAAWSQAFIVGERTAETIHETGVVPVAFGTQFKLDQQMPTTGTVGSRTFTSAYFHRYAVGGVSRPIATPPEALKVVDLTYVDWGPLSLRVMLGWNQYPKGGLIFQVDCGYGLSVVRPNMGLLFSVAE